MASALAQRRGLAKKKAILSVNTEVTPTFLKEFRNDEVGSPKLASPRGANTMYGCLQEVASPKFASPKPARAPQFSDSSSPKSAKNPPWFNNSDTGNHEASATETTREVETVRTLSACGIPEGRASLGTGSTFSSSSSICPGSPRDAADASTSAEIAVVFGDAGKAVREKHLQGHTRLGESRPKSWAHLQIEVRAVARVLDQLQEVRKKQMVYLEQLKFGGDHDLH